MVSFDKRDTSARTKSVDKGEASDKEDDRE